MRATYIAGKSRSKCMCDRGFDPKSDMPSGVLLNIPLFLDGKPQLTAEDETKTRKNASVRVHAERAIAQIKY